MNPYVRQKRVIGEEEATRFFREVPDWYQRKHVACTSVLLPDEVHACVLLTAVRSSSSVCVASSQPTASSSSTGVPNGVGNVYIYYVEPGRYLIGVTRTLMPKRWRRLTFCEKAKREKSCIPLALFVPVLSLLWLRNRWSYPKLANHGCIVNHIANEFEFTKKDRLSLNIHQRTEQYLAKLKKVATRATVEQTQNDDCSSRDEVCKLSNSHQNIIKVFSSFSTPIHPPTYRLREWGDCLSFVSNECGHLFNKVSKKQIRINSESSPIAEQRRSFVERQSIAKLLDKSIWILKPSKSSGGNGISLVTDLQPLVDEYKKLKREKDISTKEPEAGSKLGNSCNYQSRMKRLRTQSTESSKSAFLLTHQILQQYIYNPMLVNGHKFDIRAYMLVADVENRLVFYCDGYIRINSEKYDSDLEDLSNRFRHLSNMTVQKSHPDFALLSDNLRWDMPTFQKYLIEKELAEPTYVESVLKKKMKEQMFFAFHACEHLLIKKKGCFSLVGADFLLDENWQLWLLEFSKSPACYRSPGALYFNDRYTEMIAEAAEIMIELRELDSDALNGAEVLPLESLNRFERCSISGL